MKSSDLNHDRISPTAKLVAYWRQFSDIPYSKDIASLFKVDEVYKSLFKDIGAGGLHTSAFAPLFEIRYKCILHFIKQHNFKQVLEFASGISLRGLTMTEEPDITYVETDLPGLTEEKVKLIETLMNLRRIEHRANLFFHNTNILNYTEIEPALAHFNTKKPLTLVHEGLFQYLTKAEKAVAAKNIHTVLKKFGGVWITPDLDTKTELLSHTFDKKQHKGLIDNIEDATGRNFMHNAFENEDDIRNFFHDQGFNVSWQPQMNKDIILSTVHNQEVLPEITKTLQGLRLWVLTIKE